MKTALLSSPSSFSPPLVTLGGEITAASGSGLIASLPRASIGDVCSIKTADGSLIPGQIIGFQSGKFMLSPYRNPSGIYPGSLVTVSRRPLTVPVGAALLGRVIDALGAPIDDTSTLGSPLQSPNLRRQVHSAPPDPMSRPCIDTPLTTGIRSIDAFTTLGRGQRIGIFASAGVGKSTLLGMLTRNADADVIVVALVGERGREVREFVEDTLGPEAMQRAVLVVATSDQPSLQRQLAPFTATTIAEYFRDQGKNVLLIVDSLTRTARAIRETSLAAGELPVRHGYTPSVYTELPKLVERAGTSPHGTITALYTVLTNEDGDVDPLADEIKSLLDGHIVLSKDVIARGIRPAVDISKSVSRLMGKLHSKEYLAAASKVISGYARLEKERFTVLLGGTPDDTLKKLLDAEPSLVSFLSQSGEPLHPIEVTRKAVMSLAVAIG